MGVIRSIREVKLLAARSLPGARLPYARPEFARPAGAALLVSLAFLLAPTWPLFALFAPSFVVACRYYELARYETVRVSGWLFLLLFAVACSSLIWTLKHHSGGLGLSVELALVGLSLASGGHLWLAQKKLHLAMGRRSWQDLDDDEIAPVWSGGGLLAMMPVLFVVGFIASMWSWRSPLMPLWGMTGLALIAVQLRGHPAFPRLTILWLVLLFGIKATNPLADNDARAGDVFLTIALLLGMVGLAIYLEFHPRIRRTFRRAPRTPSAAQPAAGAPTVAGGTAPRVSPRPSPLQTRPQPQHVRPTGS